MIVCVFVGGCGCVCECVCVCVCACVCVHVCAVSSLDVRVTVYVFFYKLIFLKKTKLPPDSFHRVLSLSVIQYPLPFL